MIEGVAEYNLDISGVLVMFLVIVACGYMALEKAFSEQAAPVSVPVRAA
jgi:hypothetical protein